MTKIKPDESSDFLSVKDMRETLEDEIHDVMKSAELRIREFSDFTAAYVAGELTPEQATDKYHRYMDKWGEALPGVPYARNKSDAEILADVEASAAGEFAASEIVKRAIQEKKAKSPRSAG